MGSPPLEPRRRFEVEVSTLGLVDLDFGAIGGLNRWVDGKPTPITKPQRIDFASGRDRLTLMIDRAARTDPLRVELVDIDGSPKLKSSRDSERDSSCKRGHTCDF